MSDEKPKALNDLVKGLGLLFRAAKTTVEKLPTKDFEQVMVKSAREVSRAFENVGKTLEREVFGRRRAGPEPHPDERPVEGFAPGANKTDEKRPAGKAEGGANHGVGDPEDDRRPPPGAS